MKALVFKRNSWHHWLATKLGDMSMWNDSTNICEYTRYVIKGFLALCLVTAMGIGMLYWVAITLAWWAAIAMYGYVMAEGPIVLTMLIVIHGFGGLAAYLGNKAKNAIRERRQAGTTDSFTFRAWDAWKDKTCVQVTFNSEESQ